MASLASLAADIGNLFGLEGIVSDVTDLAVAGAFATGAVVAADIAFQKVGFLARRDPLVQNAIAIAGGFILGSAAGKISQGAGLGIGTGLVTWGAARTAKWALNKYVFNGTPGSFTSPLAGGLGATPGDDLLLGLRGLATRDVSLLPGQTQFAGIQTRDSSQAYPGAPMQGFQFGSAALS